MLEKDLSVDPISSARSHRGFTNNLGEIEGQEELLESNDEREEESENDEKVKKVR